MAEQQNVPKKVNNQISNTGKIEKLTGYTPGKVYLYDEDKAKNKESFDSVKRWEETDYLIRDKRSLSRGVYDINTGNFHIVPDDDNTRLEYLDLINKAIHILKPAISERLREILNDPTAKCRCGRGVPKTHLDIEKYISFTYKGYDYLLCFERLYKNGNQINSLLGAFQFYRQPDRQPVKFYMFYPESCKDGEKTPDKIESPERIVYNPVGLPSVATVAKGNGVKAVCDAFINFIGI